MIPAFMIAILLLGAAFITSTTYTQLGIAILLYPILAFFGYKIFLDNNTVPLATAGAHPHDTFIETAAKEQIKTRINNTITVADIDKRAFLKLLGATGISFFLISVFGQKIQSLLFGAQGLTQRDSAVSPQNAVSVSSPTAGYNIAELDEGSISYFGFINKEAGWFIMKGDNDSGSFRYARGKSDFPGNWKRRQILNYDYFSQVFP